MISSLPLAALCAAREDKNVNNLRGAFSPILKGKQQTEPSRGNSKKKHQQASERARERKAANLPVIGVAIGAGNVSMCGITWHPTFSGRTKMEIRTRGWKVSLG
jgi:hypothetical protein